MSSPVEISAATLDALISIAVEAVAASHPDPENPFRGLYISDELALALANGAPSDYVDERLAAVSRALALDPLDTAVLGLCAAPELNPRYGRLFAYLQDDVTRRLASPRLVAQLLRGLECATTDVLERFAHDAPLRASGTIRLLGDDPAVPLAEQQVKVPARLAAALIGARIDEPGGDGRLRRPGSHAGDPGRPEHVGRLRALFAHDERLPIVIAGPDAAAIVAHAIGRPLLLARLADIGEPDVMAEAALACGLDGLALCFDGVEELDPADREHVLRQLDARKERTLILAATPAVVTTLGDRTILTVELPPPDVHERERAWLALAGARQAGDVAAKFRLSMAQIADGARAARLAAAARRAEEPTADDLDLGARQASSTRLGELATRLATEWRWRELIVPAKQLEQLQSISAYLRHRDHVLTDWEYEGVVSRHQGLKALFAGESGTGKTMAAQVLAAELGLDIYRVDLATIVSKYIGDTEKNLDRIFAAAEGSNAILFFDEADALFGKRSDVGDAHDRYANIEVAYLLQKMDGYAGAVILATNLRRNIDAAFMRRLDFVIDFPFPELEDRRRLWERLLPAAAPRADDVDLDFLAKRFKLSGGAIRNCTLSAAFQAADEGGAIAMRHLVRAVAREYGKLGRLTLETDFKQFHAVIRPWVTVNGNDPDEGA